MLGRYSWNRNGEKTRFASYVGSYKNGFSVSLNYSKDSNDGRSRDIDKSMYDAATAF